MPLWKHYPTWNPHIPILAHRESIWAHSHPIWTQSRPYGFSSSAPEYKLATETPDLVIGMFTQTVNENQNTYTIHKTRNSIDTPSRIERNQGKYLHRKSTPRSGNAYYTVNIKHVPRSSCLQLIIFSEVHHLLTEINDKTLLYASNGLSKWQSC